jgi:hypothetical protein
MTIENHFNQLNKNLKERETTDAQIEDGNIIFTLRARNRFGSLKQTAQTRQDKMLIYKSAHSVKWDKEVVIPQKILTETHVYPSVAF